MESVLYNHVHVSNDLTRSIDTLEKLLKQGEKVTFEDGFCKRIC